MVQGEGQLSQIKLDVLLGEHDFLGEAREKVAAPKKVQDEVQFAVRLECVVEAYDERVPHVHQDVPLHLGPLTVPHL